MSFAETLQKLMDAAGVSQNQLAKKSGVPQSTISRYLLEASKPKIAAVEKLAKALKVPVGELLGEGMAARPLNSIPVLGFTAAGTPLDPKPNGDELVFGEIFRGDVVACRVKGRSMEQVGIRDGDWVIVRRCPFTESGVIVLVSIDNCLTLKTLKADRDRKTGKVTWWLHSHPVLDDDHYRPRAVDPDVPTGVAGVYVGVVRKV